MSLLITEGLGISSGGGGGILPMKLAASTEIVRLSLTVADELQLEVASGDRQMKLTSETGHSMTMRVSGGSMKLTTHCGDD